MAYTEEMTWANVVQKGTRASNIMRSALNDGLRLYNEWQSFRAGRTNAQIATALSQTEADVAALDACISACKDLYDCANNVAVSQSDRFFSLRKFQPVS